jgi:hypothetical protein
MRKILVALIAAGVALCVGFGTASAIHLKNKKAIGWFDRNAPLGGAYWFTDNVGIQAGIGFNKINLPDAGEDPDAAIAFAAAVPIRIAGPETCHFYFRPGFFYETNPGEGLDSFVSVRADLAVEYYLSHHFSIVGGHGVEYISLNPEGDFDSTTRFQTRPISDISVGFYYYFGNSE